MRRYAIILIGFTSIVLLVQFISCGKKEEVKKPGLTATFEVQDGFTTWEKLYGEEKQKLIGMDVGMTPDGGYFIVGNSGWERDNEKIYMLKLDSLGNKIWDKALGKSYSLWARSFVPAFDDGYVIISQGIRGEDNEMLINIMKVNSTGDYRWDRVLDISGEDACGDIGRTVDSNYIITGNTASIEAGGNGIFLAKVDRSGNLIWKKTYFDLKVQGGFSLMVENDGYLIIGKVTQTKPHANDDMVMMKTDTAGNVMWLKNMGGESNEKAFALNKTDDGGYVVAGTSNNADNRYIDDIYITRLNAERDIIWEKTYGGIQQDAVASIVQVSDGGFVMAGASRSMGEGIIKIYLFKVDSDGELLWEKAYKAGDRQETRAMLVCPDGGYLVVGFSRKEHASELRVYTIKTDQNGNAAFSSAQPDSIP